MRKNWNRCNANVVIRELVGSGDVKIIEVWGLVAVTILIGGGSPKLKVADHYAEQQSC